MKEISSKDVDDKVSKFSRIEQHFAVVNFIEQFSTINISVVKIIYIQAICTKSIQIVALDKIFNIQ